MAKGKVSRGAGRVTRERWNDVEREASFDPVLCTMKELEIEIAQTKGARRAYLAGVRHARIIVGVSAGLDVLIV